MTPTTKRRAGFTLIELLVVITIIAMLGTMSVVVSRAAIESAKRSRTEMTIAKIDSVINSIYEQYQNKRVDLTPYLKKIYDSSLGKDYWLYDFTYASGSGVPNPLWDYHYQEMMDKIPDGPDVAISYNHAIVPQLWRLHLLRDTIRIEMPCWAGDVGNPSLPDGSFDPTRPLSGLVGTYQQALTTVFSIKSLVDWDVQDHADFNAKLLYLVVTNGMPESREQFTSKDIGTDSVTGLSYFIDGWGNPIHWLRWAPGIGEVRSVLPPAFISLLPVINSDSDRQYVGNLSIGPGSQSDDDPTDPLEIDQSCLLLDPSTGNPVRIPSWLLVPYIFSSGPDGLPGIDPGYYFSVPNVHQMVNTYPFLFDATNPTAPTNLSAGSLDGTGEHLDNIHNHKVRR